jgi:hypothetical protein
VFHEIAGQMLSPADMLAALLNVEPEVIDGPVSPGGATTWRGPTIPAPAFQRAAADTAEFVRRTHRLPSEVFIGAETLSLADFAATLAGHVLNSSGEVRVVRGQMEFDRYFATDPRKPFNWVIHAESFSAGPLLDLGRLQGWTLKPARLLPVQ